MSFPGDWIKSPDYWAGYDDHLEEIRDNGKYYRNRGLGIDTRPPKNIDDKYNSIPVYQRERIPEYTPSPENDINVDQDKTMNIILFATLGVIGFSVLLIAIKK